MIRLYKNIFKNYLLFPFVVILIGVSVLSFITQKTKEWKSPPQADLLVNPFRNDSGAMLEGKKLFKAQCVVCHGEKGKGDGIAGANLNPRPANFLAPSERKETDGAIYWKITAGNAPMPSYKLALTEPQRWKLVNYIRELQKLN